MRWTQVMMREVAKEERMEVGLNDFQPLDPRQIAAAHGIPVYPLSQLADSRAATAICSGEGPSAWRGRLPAAGSGESCRRGFRTLRRRRNVWSSTRVVPFRLSQGWWVAASCRESGPEVGRRAAPAV